MKCRRTTCQGAGEVAGWCKYHYRKRHAIGATAGADSAPILEHIEKLHNLGWTYKEIGAAVGKSHSWVPMLVLKRGIRKASNEAAKALLEIPLVPRDSKLSTASAGSRRRLEALARIGWTKREIARRIGVPEGTVASENKSHTMSFALANKIAAVYEELSNVPGPSSWSVKYATAQGWHEPAAWADIDAGVLAVSTIGARRRVQALIAMGHTYMAIAAASGLSRQSVYKIAVGLTDTLMVETVDKVLIGFEALSKVPGTCWGSIAAGRERNWAAPGMWDDIDDPNEVVDCSEDPDLVDELLVEQFIKGQAGLHRLNDAEKAYAVKRLQEKGLDPEQIAIRMRRNWKTKAELRAAA